MSEEPGKIEKPLIAKYLPQEVVRTCEIGEWNNEEHILQSIPFLKPKG